MREKQLLQFIHNHKPEAAQFPDKAYYDEAYYQRDQ